MFELIDVSLSAGEKTILRGVNAEIGVGFNVVRAPSGGGKTTFLRMLNYLVKPSSGTLKYGGRDISTMDLTVFRSRCVMVPQRIVFSEGSVEENIVDAFRLKNHADKVMDRGRLESLLETLNMKPDILSSDASVISGGEAQRIAIIRALLLNPECLIIDEPSSALDREVAGSLFGVLGEFADGHVLVVSSHDESVLGYADTVFEISKGELRRID